MGSPNATIAAQAYPTSVGEDLTLVQFKEGERVLANNKGCFYEAKVVKVENQVNECKYLVHYPGWNKKWDEWLGVDCLLKYTDKNVEKQRELATEQGVETTVVWNVSKNKPRNPIVQAARRGRKRKQVSVDTVVESVDTIVSPSVDEQTVAPSNNIVPLPIPAALRKQLMDDSEFVSEMKLVHLPCSPNVEDILKKYCESTVQKHGRLTDSVDQILKGLRIYFDKALQKQLLYNNEQEQYKESVTADASPSTVYGAEHFLRLFIKLPVLIAPVNIAEETLKELHESLVDILRFLRKNQASFFVAQYKKVEEMEQNDEVEMEEEGEKKEDE